MKNHNLTFPTLVFTLLLAVTGAPAQAGQNPPPYQWKFEQVVAEKIHKTLARGGMAVGLSLFEQKTLEKYGISIGRSFITRVHGEWRRVTRTSAGLRLEGPARSSSAWNLQQFPIQTHYRVLPASFTEHNWENIPPALA